MGLLTPPKMHRVDIVFSYRNFLRQLLLSSGQTIYRHKIKSIVCIMGIFAAHKTFGLYKSIMGALNPLSELTASMENGDEDDEENLSSKSDGNTEETGAIDPLRQHVTKKKSAESREEK